MAAFTLTVASVMAALALIAKYITAAANVATSVLQGLLAWFVAHKTLFSLTLLAAWVAVWVTLAGLLFRVAAWVASITLGTMPSYAFLHDGFAVLNAWIPLRYFSSTIGLIFAGFSARIAIQRVFWARMLVANFIKSVSATFHG